MVINYIQQHHFFARTRWCFSCLDLKTHHKAVIENFFLHAGHIIHSWRGPWAVQTTIHGQVVAPQGPLAFPNFFF